MTSTHVLRGHRARPSPWPSCLSRFGLASILVLTFLGAFHLSLSRMMAQEMELDKNERRPYQDQLESPLVLTDKLSYKPVIALHQRVSDQVDSSIDTFDTDVIERRQSYLKKCSAGLNTTLGPEVNSFISFDLEVNMAYCFVAKIGCTFWLRIFSFLTRRDEMVGLGINTPFDIDRIALHTGKLMTKMRRRFPQFQPIAKPETLKFLFARNPYERLWSVFLDKYYLPDYWMFDSLGPNLCGINSTFTQFLNAAVTSKDHHVTPVSTACNPCVFQPDVIGKMETFSRDSKHILDQSGHGHLLANYNHSNYVDIEMVSLVVYNFKLLDGIKTRLGHDNACLTAKSLCQRLWRVFQINGHIRASLPFPGDFLVDFSLESAKTLFLETVRENPMSKEESRLQRRRFLAAAYSKIAPSLLLEVQNRYRSDFEMFDYDIEPPRFQDEALTSDWYSLELFVL